MWALFADLAKKIWYTKLTGSKKFVKSVALRHIFLTAQGRFNEQKKTTFHHNKINDESSNGKHLGYNKCSIHPNSIPRTVFIPYLQNHGYQYSCTNGQPTTQLLLGLYTHRTGSLVHLSSQGALESTP